MTREQYLVDTSALVRYFRGQVSERWDKLIAAGRVSLCEPVRLEFLRAAGGLGDFLEADHLLTEMFPYEFVPDSVWTESAELQRSLAQQSWFQCASVVDLAVAVTARWQGLTVLHLDRDFEVIAKVTGQPVQRVD
ncbi:PIN domain nuclease [Streptomyces sp. SID3343]|uniref:PIN domain nuclease n=1 Tax=Streptomyces sp. SID3343 TaxID=2690260 RepID=UPI00136DF886|nr:PIN domain nuclease [Streptomyces sp. SID3343]MYW03528.1 PIN domain-containing protein [Streptomyces sp. SID3343]